MVDVEVGQVHILLVTLVEAMAAWSMVQVDEKIVMTASTSTSTGWLLIVMTIIN